MGSDCGKFRTLRISSGVRPGHLVENGLRFPPFSYLSPESQRGVRVSEHVVPALGDANSPAGSSVWSYDVSDLRHPQLLARLRLGQPIRPAPNGVVGGASPSALASTAEHVYVALSHEDAVETMIPLTPFNSPDYLDKKGRPLRGVMPSGLAVHGSRLCVTEAGINAVAVIDMHTGHVIGHIPVGWNPSAVEVSADGRTLLPKDGAAAPMPVLDFTVLNTTSAISNSEPSP